MDLETQIATQIGRMYIQITQMQIELDFLRKKLQEVENGDGSEA